MANTLPQAQINKPKWDVMVTGRYFCDLILTGLPEMPHLGDEVWCKGFELVPGASFIPAVALHRLGLRVAWPCYFGNDLFSQFVRDQVRRENLNEDWFLEYDHPSLGITLSLSFASERAFISYQDEMPELPYPDLIRQIQPRWVMLMNLWKGKKLEEFLEAARQSNTRVFMDCQAHKTNLDDPEVRSALQQVDVFSLTTRDEALNLTGSGSIDAALAVLAAICPLVVIKLGKEGAVAQQGSQVFHVSGIGVTAIDTTGAGDNFDSGFVYAQLKGYSLEDSLVCANICGGLSTEACGGTASAPTVAVVEKWRNLS